MVFAIKELSMCVSILGKWEENPDAQMYLFKFHIDFISHAAGGRSELARTLPKLK